ncbi:DNA polymerase III subunit epsilon [Agrobacterium rubi]|uniref:DNA polymerase III subunit epsilon n=1 Tax=Agrobacterium rubi TaxID=28099 RepID=A0AAE7UP83_9HYPH|nr:DNA polymerase III subunit epsilon [Agrobacterium rubi]NTE87553.1 DNA polymerase III subunit epsilon [Agrobacterium rubi]NTF03407.1 DNA polymerase III subunit epsilon [Agrobacterium rubi]NTF37567.1 DNA polymerase III subunit epsilon [Agrobacterium rubi]OCJ45734.1 DNA polymerase III subunit epsilon [Agrobacterium rubi]QTG00264.1 DNA polymerase III subunit epsilon [Agrobacterium rubi]
MREIIFDTETTGLESKADRIIEIGGIELFNHFPTGRTLHLYINPGDRKVHPDALAVHGITDEFLQDKPKFEEVVQEIRDFFEGARWVAHNATFDMGFINAEFARIGIESVSPEVVTDTLSMARRKHPMGPNSLDALCRRYGIDNSHRTKHGALLDSELLAEVYIEMIGGRQTALGFGSSAKTRSTSLVEDVPIEALTREKPLPSRLNPDVAAAHCKLVLSMGDKAIWNKYQQN